MNKDILPDLNNPNLPNVYHVQSFFDDGLELCPLSEAIVVAKSEGKALRMLIQDDQDEDRKTDWGDPNTEVEQIGWAAGNLTERIVLIINGYIADDDGTSFL